MNKRLAMANLMNATSLLDGTVPASGRIPHRPGKGRAAEQIHSQISKVIARRARKSSALKLILGQPSYSVTTREVKAAVTQVGGHLGPVTFLLGGRSVQPFSIAPWYSEKHSPEIPPVVRVLRGDFFCMPFGGNEKSFRGEKHPTHGETANNRWRLAGSARKKREVTLRLAMTTKIRPAHVDKRITLVPGQTVIYQEHIISGMRGPMSLGHHAMLKCPDHAGAARVSTSRFIHGQVYVEPVERPEQRGYSILKPGAVFSDLKSVPTVTGALADLSRYPARRGFEDIAILVADPKLPVAWSAVAFPEEGYVWFSLRDPRVLASTLIWMSNGGRHYPPWNGRHCHVIGVEDITGFFHSGLAESAAPNPLSEHGCKTHHVLNPKFPFSVKYIMGVAAIPKKFDRVKNIIVEGKFVTLASDSGLAIRTPVNTGFLKSSG